MDQNGRAQSGAIFNGVAIGKILVHPTDPGIVFVGTVAGPKVNGMPVTITSIGVGYDPPFGGAIPPAAPAGLWRLRNITPVPDSVVSSRLKVSTAGGCFDTPCTGNRSVSDLVFDPDNPSVLVVWVNGTFAGDGGVYRSANALDDVPFFTQTLVTTGNSNIVNIRGTFGVYRREGSQPVMYVATAEDAPSSSCNGEHGALRVSSDGGNTWSDRMTGGGGFCGGQCDFDIAIRRRRDPAGIVRDPICIYGLERRRRGFAFHHRGFGGSDLYCKFQDTVSTRESYSARHHFG